MTSGEWHQLTLPGRKRARSLIRRSYAAGLASPEGLAGRAINRVLAKPAAGRLRAGIESDDLEGKRSAIEVSVKLMDYQLFLLPSIERGFGAIKPLILTRHPLAQAESLMRGNLSVQSAARWCAHVLTLMAWVQDRWSAPVFRFEDLLDDPEEFTRGLYAVLHLAPEHNDLYRLKQKDYGEQRDELSASLGRRVYVSASDLRRFVNPDVNDEAIGRLSRQQRRTITDIAQPSAERFGYTF